MKKAFFTAMMLSLSLPVMATDVTPAVSSRHLSILLLDGSHPVGIRMVKHNQGTVMNQGWLNFGNVMNPTATGNDCPYVVNASHVPVYTDDKGHWQTSLNTATAFASIDQANACKVLADVYYPKVWTWERTDHEVLSRGFDSYLMELDYDDAKNH